MKTARLGLVAVAALLAFALPAVAQANEVTKWNEIAVNTINAQPSPVTSAPNAGAVFVAMVQGAVYGAVNAVDRHGKPYLVNRSFPKASVDAAAATAAYKVLSALFPSGALDTAYAASLDDIDDGAAKDQGIAVGTMAADAMLAEGHDGRAGQFGCAFVTPSPGVWQPLPNPMNPLVPACDPSSWVSNANPFILNSPSQFRTPGPYDLDSPEYAKDYNEVKDIGSLNSDTRTDEQTHAAAFWQTNPAANYNALARRFVDQFGLGVTDSARLFAMLDLSAADAIIDVWNDKYHYRFWRPITAIRQGDTDGRLDTVGDPTWTPLFSAGFPTSPPLPASPLPIGGVGGPLGTPPYPDHPSGATAYASASMHALASFFGTDAMSTGFFLTSGRYPGEQRLFTRFSDVTNEILEARIWAGIHFRNPDVQAANLGREVEQYTHETQFDFVP
jgi:hypothetical protein